MKSKAQNHLSGAAPVNQPRTKGIFLSVSKRTALAMLWLAAISPLAADPLDQWFWRNPLPQGNSLASVVFAQNLFVAVGQGGTILTSSNGTNWILQTSPTANSLANVAWLNGKFIAVGEKGTILTSADATNWTIVPSGVTTTLSASAYGGGSYVIVGPQGTVLQSSTGLSWSKCLGISTSLYLNSVAFGAGTFIAITSQGEVIQSWDGSAWNPESSLGGYPNQVAYLSGRFIIMDERMWSSVDGFAWASTWVNPAPDVVTVAEGSYIGAGAGGVIQVSNNGTNWSWMTAYQSSGDLTGIAFGNSTYVAVGALGVIRTSTDRTNWFFRNRALSNGGTLYGLTYANGEFVAVGEGEIGPGGILEQDPLLFSGSSSDWYARASGNFTTLEDIAYGQGLYVLAGGYGIRTSTNGIDWTNRSSGLSGQLSSVNYVNGLFILTGWSGSLSTSPDGITWTPRTTGATTKTLMDTTYGNGLFVSVARTPGGSSGAVLTSGDGVTWTNRSTVNLCGICFAKGLFVVVGDGGVIRTSANAVNWTTQLSGVASSLWGIAYGDGYFVAVGDQGVLLTSPDGISWARRNASTSQSLQKVVYGRGTFVAVGGGSTIVQSAPTIPSLQLRPAAGAPQMELSLLGGFDRAYAVETCSNLNSSDWSAVTTLPPGQRQFVDSDTAHPRKFYRVTVP